MEGMDKEAIPDLDGWEAYCERCKAFREARRAQERDVGDGTEYFEFVCKTCHSILLTFQRLGMERPENKPAEMPAVSARCPHCGDLNVFPLILPYAGFSAQPEMMLGGCQWLSCRIQEVQMQGLP